MLDGRIDTQGVVADLRDQGVLEGIEHSAMIDAHREKLSLVEKGVAEELLDDTSKPDVIKKPRKLVKDEHRETGGVKWSVYKTYLRASYVISKISGCLLMPLRSYWTWIILALLIVVSQLLVIGEKLWIMVRYKRF